MRKGSHHTAETLSRMKQSHKGAKSWNKGRVNVYSEETLKRMSEVKQGKKLWPNGRVFSEEHCNHISEGHKGKGLSDEHKLRISQSCKGLPQLSYWKGKTFSPETREKLSRVHRGKKHTPERIRHVIEGRARNRDANRPTKIEMQARSSLLIHGIRFLTNVVVEGICNADIVIPDLKTIVFCDGCYWHGCASCGVIARVSKRTNLTRQEKRILTSPVEDERVKKELEARGWKVYRFWEHEIKANPDVVGKTIVLNLHKQFSSI